MEGAWRYLTPANQNASVLSISSRSWLLKETLIIMVVLRLPRKGLDGSETIQKSNRESMQMDSIKQLVSEFRSDSSLCGCGQSGSSPTPRDLKFG